MNEENPLRSIPSLDKLLSEPWLSPYFKRFSRAFIKVLLKDTLEDIRKEINAGSLASETMNDPGKEIETRFKTLLGSTTETYLRPVINCTGIVIHTNLGRAPLSEAALKKAVDSSIRYSNLEFDLGTGERSSRNLILDYYIEKLFPGCNSVVVNNNAAAVMLVLNTFALDREVIISRGELVEIGGSFRIPEVMAKSGAVLKEVGTTNKTRLSDYEDAVSDKTGLFMTVHPSNYKITGFTQSVSPEELVQLSKAKKIPLFHDMGSGNMFLPGETLLPEEKNVSSLLSEGVPLITFSGDKLLGACQAGIIIGKPALMDKLRKNQLLRALRADKLTYAILCEIMKQYLTGEYRKNLPVFVMLSQTRAEIKDRTVKLYGKIKNENMTMEIIEGDSYAGGGSAPGEPIPTVLLALTHKKLTASEFAAKLRTSNPPVIARIEYNRVLLDLRTVFPDEENTLVSILYKI